MSMDAKNLRTSLDLIPDNAEFSRQFYQILFRDFPETEQLFQQTNWLRQYSSLMATIAFVVSGIEHGENLGPSLHRLGAKHSQRHVSVEDYPKVSVSLIATFKTVIGPAFTEKMQNSWVAAFNVISTTMIEGGSEEKTS